MSRSHEEFVEEYIGKIETYTIKNVMSKKRFAFWIEKMQNLPTTQVDIDNSPNCFNQGSHNLCDHIYSTGDGYVCCDYFPLMKMELWINRNKVQTSYHQGFKFISLIDCCPIRQGQIFIEF